MQGSKRVQGASTITQQVAKNFLLGNERSFERKIREALLSFRIEQRLFKDKILELYLNEIYLGLGNYGVAAAALNYFGKSVNELSIAEVAYLAALPKGAEQLPPVPLRDRADRPPQLRHRPHGRERLHHRAPRATRPRPSRSASIRACSRPTPSPPAIFAEEVRRELAERYGEKKLYEGGLSVRTTLDPKMQLMARKALVDGLVRYDEAHGFRGAMRKIDFGSGLGRAAGRYPGAGRRAALASRRRARRQRRFARIGLQPAREASGEVVARPRDRPQLTPDGIRWTRKTERAQLAPDPAT